MIIEFELERKGYTVKEMLGGILEVTCGSFTDDKVVPYISGELLSEIKSSYEITGIDFQYRKLYLKKK